MSEYILLFFVIVPVQSDLTNGVVYCRHGSASGVLKEPGRAVEVEPRRDSDFTPGCTCEEGLRL